MHPVIRKLHDAQLRKDLPEFRPGDTVRVNVRLLEGEGEKVKERIQAFEGVVISKKGRASSATFTVRRVSFGTGVERIFPLHSPSIASVEVTGSDRGRMERENALDAGAEADAAPASSAFSRSIRPRSLPLKSPARAKF